MHKSSLLYLMTFVMVATVPLSAVAQSPTTSASGGDPSTHAQELPEQPVEPVAGEDEALTGDALDKEVTAEGLATDAKMADSTQASEATVALQKDLLKEKNAKSKDGKYEFRRSFGVGLELGYWVNFLDRMGTYVFANNKGGKFNAKGVMNLDLFFETSFLEGTRLSLFGGIQFPLTPIINRPDKIPSALAFYGGLEPAFAFRRGKWEAAIGSGFGFGGVHMEGFIGEPPADPRTFDATLLTVRPFFEVRHYWQNRFALYGRVGFNQWLVLDYSGIGPLQVPYDQGRSKFTKENLGEGGFYLAIGTRFGSYPSHDGVIGDRDGDGYKNDVDECPDDPEDFDGFEDEDGCPDPDNDKDGILDVDDKCPNDAEDRDGFEDDDGCPDPDNDGDGIPDVSDKCPNDPEDFDGFEDEDGCPDPDNDKDGILDVNDKCPNDPEDFDGLGDDDGCPEDDFDGDGLLDTEDKCPEVPGVPQKQGCPFEKVQVTLTNIKILDKVFFNFNKDSIKRASYPLLNDVAATILAYPRIKLIEVGGHTDHKGSAKYNNDLSQRRANSVMKYLISKGVPAERLQAKGYGFSEPLVPLDEKGKESKEAAEQNRRVEFKILEQETVTHTVREDEVQRLKKEEEERAKKAKEEAAKKTAEMEKEAQ